MNNVRNIPFVNISLGEEERKAVLEVLKTGQLAQGPKVRELEDRFSQYVGTKYAIAVCNGTAALHTALYALGIEEGDEVITTPFTFVATANAILMQNADVKFVDISEEDYNIDPGGVENNISDKTRAVIPVDLYGQVYDYQAIAKLAEQHELSLIEDACQAIGARQNGRSAGTCGDVGVFSLYATKNIMSGEGGVIVMDDEGVAQKCRLFRHHGQSEKRRYEYIDLGYNYRMTDLAAAIAVEQLKKVDRLNEKRIKNANRLTDGLAQIEGLVLPQVKPGNRHVFHQYTIRVTEDFKHSRDELKEYLWDHGVGCGVYYPKPLHLHKHFQKLGYKKGDFPIAEKVSQEVLSLPVHPLLSDEDIEYIIETIQAYAKK